MKTNKIGALICFISMLACDNKKVINRFENGEIKLECEIKNGLKDGLCNEYFQNGEIKSRINWMNDTLNGKASFYHENGKLRKIVFWKNGVPDGTMKIYHKNGSLKEEVTVEEGNFVGKGKLYHQNGQLAGILEWITARGVNFTNTETRFNQQGDTTFQSHYVEINTESDTVLQQDSYSFTLELKKPIYKNLEVIVGDFDKEFYLQSGKADTLYPEGFIFDYEISPIKLGIDTIRLIINDYKKEIHDQGGSKKNYQPYYFEHKFYVEALR